MSIKSAFFLALALQSFSCSASLVYWGKRLLAWNIQNCQDLWSGLNGTPRSTTEAPGEIIPCTSFEDLAGTIPQEVSEIPALIQDTGRYAAIGASIPKGILLYGPAGTGKTSIARAIAGEAGAALFTASGSEFIEMYVGVGPARIRELFAKARDAVASGAAPKALIFIDEIDAIGGKRDHEQSSEYRNTLNELLKQMDGFNQDPDIIVIAATNNLHMLDQALIRPGRFDRLVKIDLPDEASRTDILALYLSKTCHSATTQCLETIARMTTNFSPAEIKNIVNEAGIKAVRGHRDTIEDDDLLAVARTAAAQKRALR